MKTRMKISLLIGVLTIGFYGCEKAPKHDDNAQAPVPVVNTQAEINSNPTAIAEELFARSSTSTTKAYCVNGYVYLVTNNGAIVQMMEKGQSNPDSSTPVACTGGIKFEIK